MWMGVYPESFMAPIRGDVGALVARIDRAAPEGDAHIKMGQAKAVPEAKPNGRRTDGPCKFPMADLAEILLTVASLVLLIAAAWGGEKSARLITILSAAALFGASFLLMVLAHLPDFKDGALAFSGQYSMDAFGSAAKFLIYLAAIICLMVAPRFFPRTVGNTVRNIQFSCCSPVSAWA